SRSRLRALDFRRSGGRRRPLPDPGPFPEVTRMRRNPTEFAILGLLAEQPMTGYDIKREVEARLSSFWSESYGHIYPMLRRLRERKLVTMRLVAGRSGPAHRKLYALTAAGRAALGAWFETPITP